MSIDVNTVVEHLIKERFEDNQDRLVTAITKGLNKSIDSEIEAVVKHLFSDIVKHSAKRMVPKVVERAYDDLREKIEADIETQVGHAVHKRLSKAFNSWQAEIEYIVSEEINRRNEEADSEAVVE